MPITMLDVVQDVVGEQEIYTMADFDAADRPMLAGCERCAATLGGYNTFPSRSGYTRCEDCIGEDGFETVEELRQFESELEERANDE